MGKTTIEWTHFTFNPWLGCTHVSPGCTNCYAEISPGVKFKGIQWGAGKKRWRTSPSYWKEPLKWNKAAEKLGVRARVFCASLADVFDAEVPDEWRSDLFDLIRRTPHLDWLLLTKRPENVMAMLSAAQDAYVRTPGCTMETVDMLQAWVDGKPPQNVWVGTSVEDQKRVFDRIRPMLNIPAVVRFLSCEPLLEPLDLGWVKGKIEYAAGVDMGIHWVIVGGESGTKARPFDPLWAVNIKEQCENAGAAFFMKQMGSNPVAYTFADRKGGEPSEWPADLRVRQFPEVRLGERRA